MRPAVRRIASVTLFAALVSIPLAARAASPQGPVVDVVEIAGVRSVLLQAPLGTYTSWNPVAAGALKGNEGNLAAGSIPFAMTKAARLASGDPRRSVEERYGSQEGYNCLVSAIAKNEVRKRFLLQEDADRLIAQAAASPVLPSDPGNRTALQLCEKLDRDDDHHEHDD